MGRRVEYILILAILTALVIPFFISSDNTKDRKKEKVFDKSGEINNFIEYEINSTKLQHTLRAKKAEEVDKKWYLNEPNITTDKIESLSSKSSILTAKKVEFHNNVVAVKVDGTIYKSNNATYNIETKTLTTPKKFTINRHVNIVSGKDLHYDSKYKITKAKDVNATFVLKKAKK